MAPGLRLNLAAKPGPAFTPPPLRLIVSFGFSNFPALFIRMCSLIWPSPAIYPDGATPKKPLLAHLPDIFSPFPHRLLAARAGSAGRAHLSEPGRPARLREKAVDRKAPGARRRTAILPSAPALV